MNQENISSHSSILVRENPHMEAEKALFDDAKKIIRSLRMIHRVRKERKK
jgi:hypothetical protein